MTASGQGGSDLRRRWNEGDVTFGGWCSIADPFVTEIMGRSGFDWLCLDMQHGLIGMESLLPMLQASDAAGVPALVRVPDASGPWIPRALDFGAVGVIVPMVESAEDARAIVRSARYAPVGHRSWGPTRASVRMTTYDAPTANDSSLVIVMVETPDGVNNVDEIMTTPGVDAVFIGPADLALSHGWSPSDRRTASLIDQLIVTGKSRKVPIGIFCQDVSEVGPNVEKRVPMIAVMSDVRLLKRAAASVMEHIRSEHRSVGPSPAD